METKDLILMSMAAASMNNGNAGVALYLDEEATHRCADGVTRWLPVIVLDAPGGGYAPFVRAVQDQVATYFGALEEVAQLRVEEINTGLGLDSEAANALVWRSMAVGGEVDA